MYLSHESSPDDQQLVRYLLGLLADEDAERVDELTIAHDDIAWRVRIVENDLVDAYVRGALGGETLKQFESFYVSSLSSPRRREKVRFAESFLRAVDAAAKPANANAETGQDAARGPAGRKARSASQGSRWYARIVPRATPAWSLAAAAALLLAIFGALSFQGTRLRHELSETRQTSAALDQRAQESTTQLTDQRSAKSEATKEVGKPPAEEPPAEEPPASRPARAITTVALVLLPQTRATGPIATLAMRPGTDRVAFNLQLESNDFSRYQVALKDPATSHIIWRSNSIAAKPAGREATVSIIVPARVLKPQHYALELTGRGAARRAEVIGSYPFRIV
jgi:hypothetical protein